jgi:hypothetical protein
MSVDFVSTQESLLPLTCRNDLPLIDPPVEIEVSRDCHRNNAKIKRVRIILFVIPVGHAFIGSLHLETRRFSTVSTWAKGERWRRWIVPSLSKYAPFHVSSFNSQFIVEWRIGESCRTEHRRNVSTQRTLDPQSHSRPDLPCNSWLLPILGEGPKGTWTQLLDQRDFA